MNVYLNDKNGKPIDLSGVTGTAIVLAAKKKDTIKILPTDGNMMTGTGSFLPDPDMRAQVSLTISGVKQQALFFRLKPQKQ